MTFQIQISNYVLGNLTDSDLPEIGLTGLEEGLESESLNILAGMNPNDNSFQLVDYFNKAIDELNILIPSKREAAIRVALHYTDLILLGKLDPVNGVQKIINYCLRNYNFYDETKNYVMDSINF